MTLTTWTTYKWTDSRLAWDPSKNNNISELKFNYDQVWNPDVVPYYKQEPSTRFDNYKAIVYSSGMVLMVPEETFKVYLNLLLNYGSSKFHCPLDDHKLRQSFLDLLSGQR